MRMWKDQKEMRRCLNRSAGHQECISLGQGTLAAGSRRGLDFQAGERLASLQTRGLVWLELCEHEGGQKGDG